MQDKIKYIIFESILEMIENNEKIYKEIIENHKKGLGDLSPDSTKKIKGEFFELFANYNCFKNGHTSLISTKGKRHGYDGIYLDNDSNIYFMEAKYHDNTFNNIFSKEEKTIQEKMSSRTHEIENAQTTLIDAKTNIKNNTFKFNRKSSLSEGKNKIFEIKINKNYENSMEKLDKYLESISYKDLQHHIEDEDKVFYLANNEIGDKMTIKKNIKGAICVTIKRKEI